MAYEIIGHWPIGYFQENGVIIDHEQVEIGKWTQVGTDVSIILNKRGGNITYDGTYNEDLDTIDGTYENYEYAWQAQVDDEEATYLGGSFSMEKQFMWVIISSYKVTEGGASVTWDGGSVRPAEFDKRGEVKVDIIGKVSTITVFSVVRSDGVEWDCVRGWNS